MRASGQCDTSIVESVIADISKCGHGNIAVIKSTIPPGSTQQLDAKYANDRLVAVLFNPEFLTEANAIDDFKNQDRIVLGAPERCALDHVAGPLFELESLYRVAYPRVKRALIHSTEAELVKYVTNCFLAAKVALANEFYQICQKLGASYGDVAEVATLDKRLGDSFWKVPGPVLVDGEPAFGFGASCLPKDLRSLSFVAERLGVDAKMLRATWEKNLEVRQPHQRDWELMPKAVTNS
jgi:UDPglucose 6-dehydrogenase